MSTIRTYRAASVRDALRLVRAELGADALILGRREVSRRPFPWHRTRVETEITAASTGRETTSSAQPRSSPVASNRHTARQSATTEHPRSQERQPAIASHLADQEDHVGAGELPGGGREKSRAPLSTRKGRATGLESRPTGRSSSPIVVDGPSDQRFQLYTQLIEQAVDADIARVLLGELSPSRTATASGDLVERCRVLMAESTPCTGGISITPGQRRIVALVGPTGVGKTTTVAKLAANFRLRDQLRVGLVTVDTYRVAAVEQLRTYAELIDVPMHVVTTPSEMSAVLDDLADMDLVLIDTVGRSPSDDLRIQELRGFLQAAHADEVHLVASLTAGGRHLAWTVERFQCVGPTSLLLTKLDEATGSGAVVSSAWEANLPLSYITTGQDVPQDIETADPTVIAQRVLADGREAIATGVPAVSNGAALRPQSRVA